MPNTIELFAGCGGLLDGFERTGLYTVKACVEWEEAQTRVLKRRLRDTYHMHDVDRRVIRFDIQRTDELLHGVVGDENYGDITGLLELSEGEDIDIITGGPPCQAYSIAGRIRDQHGMQNDYRNFLFESYLRVVDEFRPKLFVFENVEGILSAHVQEHQIIDLIREGFDNIGYEIVDDLREYALLDMADFGVPQHRNRVIIIGFRRDGEENIQELLHHFYRDILATHRVERHRTVRDAIGNLPPLLPLAEPQRIGRKKYSHTPFETAYMQHNPRFHNLRDIEIFRDLAQDIQNGTNIYTTIEALQRLYYERTGNTSNIHKYNVLRWDQPSNTIPAHLKKDGLRHIHPDPRQARSITVREAARLQSFSDDFEFDESSSKGYEMIGNAVPPLFAEKLARSVYDFYNEV